MQRVDVNSVLLQITHIPLSDPGGLRQSATSSHLSHWPHPVCLSDGKSPHISRNKRSFLQASFFFFFFYVPFNLTSSRFFYTSQLRLEQILIDIPPVDPSGHHGQQSHINRDLGCGVCAVSVVFYAPWLHWSHQVSLRQYKQYLKLYGIIPVSDDIASFHETWSISFYSERRNCNSHVRCEKRNNTWTTKGKTMKHVSRDEYVGYR